VSDNSSLYVSTAVPERYISQFLENPETISGTVRIPSLSDATFAIVVSTVSSLVNVQSKTFDVRAEITYPGSAPSLIPGLFASVSLVVESRADVASLPYSALSGGDTLWYVDERSRAQKIDFVPDYASADRFQIPLEYRDYRFIESGQYFIAVGTPVRVVGDAP
jgi:multidrug efflux pump subunit AcrA (membrane-fusion protein)